MVKVHHIQWVATSCYVKCQHTNTKDIAGQFVSAHGDDDGDDSDDDKDEDNHDCLSKVSGYI